MKLDLKNKRILHELDKNARISYSEIAKRIKLSKNSVIKRIKKMEKEQIILGYNALININNLGYTTYDIYLKFKGTTLEKEQQIIEDMIKHKDIWFVERVEGNISLSLLISTKTPEEFNEIWSKVYEKIKPYVELIRIAILLEYHHFTRRYLLDSHQKELIVIGKRGNSKIDKKDETLLKIISSDVRISLLDISSKLNLNTKSVMMRIKKLEKGEIILGYKLNLNLRKMGYNYYKIMLNLNDLKVIPKVYEYISKNKNVVYYDKFIGGKDFEFDLEIESFDKFVQFMMDLKKTFGKSIKDYEYINPTIIYKSSYFSR